MTYYINKEKTLINKEQEDWKKEEDHAPAHIKAKYIMMDCEMVGIGFNGKQSARV
jgi:hypothetical protein